MMVSFSVSLVNYLDLESYNMNFDICCYLQKKKKPEKKTTIATYDISTPKGQKKGEEILNGQT